jgi:hypothetical protein
MKTRHQKLLGLLACAALTLAQNVARADYQATVLSQGPVGYWRLNETNQPPPNALTANLGSLGGSADGTYVNNPTPNSTGPFTGSSAVTLDGLSQYVSNSWQTAINPSTFSLELWVNPAVVPKFAYVAASAHLASPRSGWYLAQDDSSTFGLGNGFVVRMFYQNGVTPSITLFATNDLPLGSWYHLVLTYNGTTATLYKNGVVAQSGTPAGFVPNVDAPFNVGVRSDLAFNWPGKVAEVAMYNGALSAARVAAHYAAAGVGYSTTVLSDSPVLYHRYKELPFPKASNLGSLGAAATGIYSAGTVPGDAGPRPSAYPGFDTTNTSVVFDGSGASVSVPALNLNTNTITISGWVKASTDSESTAAGLVVCHSGTTYSGLTIDAVNGGLGLGYVWNNDPNTYNVSLTQDLGLPTLPSSADNQWAYVALVVQPAQAAVFICQSNNPASFAGVTNFFNHVVQPFAGPTLFGSDASPGTPFAGNIDEVAIFNRALGVGELYTQYGAAVGGVAPKIFTDLQGPTNSVAAGDPIVLTIDAGGTPSLTYTWHRNGSTIATTSSGTYTIATSTFGDAGDYDVTISNGFGSPAQSHQVHVTIISPTVPTITGSSGFVNRRLYTGGTIQLALSVTGGGLKYQWYKNTAPISGATASAFTIASVVIGDAGSYSVSVTNTLGTASNGPAVITIPTVPAGGFEAAVIASGPEAWWRLDEAPGSTNLWDGMGRHDGYYTNVNGTVPPVSLGAAGIGTNTAASFNNSGGVGVISNAVILNGDKYTYEGWVKTAVLNQFIVPYSSTFAGTGVWWAEVPNGYWTPDTSGGYYPISPLVPIASGVWTHLVMTYDNSIILGGNHYPRSFFINGVNISGAGIVWTDNSGVNTAGPIIIGGRGVSATTLADSFFSGLVDDVAVYAKVLSATEISNHFGVGFPATPPTFAGSFIPQTVTTGKTVSFSTTVQGTTPIKLQWYKNSSLIAGATTNSFAITNTAVSDTATYTLWATNSVGTNSQSVSLTVIPATGYANVTNNLVLHLRFDGNTTDTSGRGNNATPVGGPSFVTGLIGSQALQYTTTTATNNVTNIVATGASYATLGTPIDLLFGSSASFTVGLWVKVATNDAQGDLPYIGTATNSNNNPGWDLSPTYGSGGYQWNLNDGTNNVNVSSAANTLNDGGWHHFVMAADRAGHTVKTYLDGVLYVQTDISSLGSINVGGAVTVGQDPTGTYPFIPGASANDFAAWIPSASATLDDIGIWRRALSPLEVAQIESAGRTGGRSFDTVSPAVTLTISRSGSNLIISWPSGTLYQSDKIGAGAVWTAVPGASAPSYTFTPGSVSKFYRVQ